MTDLAKILWWIFIASLTLGVWTLPIVVVLVIIQMYLKKKHPNWCK